MTPRFHPAAQEEFIESALYYEAAREGLGQRFRDAVKVGLHRVAANPEVGSTRRNMRQVVVHGFPYNIVYRMVHGDLEVVALAHHRRRPGYWRRRV